MIRLLRRVGSLPAGTETDRFDAAAEAAFVLDGTAERVEVGAARAEGAGAAAAPGYGEMSKDELIRLAMSGNVDVKPRASKREIIDALEAHDEAR